MNRKDQKYTELTEQIKSLQPRPYDPQKLTARIMSGVESLPRRKKRIKFLEAVSWTSSIAALLLIGLLLTQKFAVPEIHDSRQTVATPSPQYMEPLSIGQIDDIIRIKRQKQTARKEFYSNIADKIKNR